MSKTNFRLTINVSSSEDPSCGSAPRTRQQQQHHPSFVVLRLIIMASGRMVACATAIHMFKRTRDLLCFYPPTFRRPAIHVEWFEFLRCHHCLSYHWYDIYRSTSRCRSNFTFHTAAGWAVCAAGWGWELYKSHRRRRDARAMSSPSTASTLFLCKFIRGLHA